MVYDKGYKIGEDGKQIHQVHGIDDKLEFLGAGDDPDDVLDGEVDRCESINPHDGIDDCHRRLLLVRHGRRRSCRRRRVVDQLLGLIDTEHCCYARLLLNVSAERSIKQQICISFSQLSLKK